MTYSSKLSSHYLELAEQPISKDVFAGEDVRFSSEYEALENERKALSLHENGQTDWLKILENSEALLRAQSKDLRVAAWLTWALYQRESFPGLLAGLGLLERLCSRHWVEIHPLKRAHSRRGHCLAGAPAGAGAERERTDREQLPVPASRRAPGKLDTALATQLGDDAPLLLPISRRLSGMLQRAADNQPEPGVVGAVVARSSRRPASCWRRVRPSTTSATPTRPCAPSRRPHAPVRLVAEAESHRSARAAPQPDDALAAHRVHARAQCRTGHRAKGVPADKLKSYQERFAQGLYADLLVELEASLARAPFWFDGQRLVWECLRAQRRAGDAGSRNAFRLAPAASAGAGGAAFPRRQRIRRCGHPWLDQRPCHAPSPERQCAAQGRDRGPRPNGTSPWTRSSRCCARTA